MEQLLELERRVDEQALASRIKEKINNAALDPQVVQQVAEWLQSAGLRDDGDDDLHSFDIEKLTSEQLHALGALVDSLLPAA
eukprot:8825829-Alexandrium_andersonii.AAC.1